jgi:hypothetical protein
VKLSDLREALAKAGVDEATAGAIVDDQLQAGKIEDDLAVDDATLDAHLDAVAKAMGAEYDEPDDDDDQAEVMAKGDELDYGDGYELDELDDEPAAELPFAEVVDEIAKGAQAIVDDVTEKHEVLAKAYMDLGRTVRAMAKAVDLQTKQLARIEKAMGGKLADMEKALDQPVPPRAQEYEALPHPGDGNGNGEAGDGMSRDEVINKAMAKLRDAGDHRERHMLKSAIAQLEMPGANHTAIAKGLGL